MKNTKAITTSIAVIIGFIIILIANYIYVENDYHEKWLICEYNSSYENYQETLNFVFISDVLYNFYREEYFSETEEKTLDELFDYFISEKEKIKPLENDTFTYKVKKEKDKVHISTYINAFNTIEFYEEYIEDKDLDFDDTIKEIENDLKNDYTCRIEKR